MSNGQQAKVAENNSQIPPMTDHLQGTASGRQSFCKPALLHLKAGGTRKQML